MDVLFSCDNVRRKELVRQAEHDINGIDYLEVLDLSDDAPQRLLEVRLLRALDGAIALSPEHVAIEGGERIRGIRATDVAVIESDGAPAIRDRVRIQVDRAGDFSTYRLRFVRGLGDLRPPAWLDPVLASVRFSFKVACPSVFDCSTQETCTSELREPPNIDYLARDYASVRALMLDRLSVTLPQWEERNAADLGVAVVEVLAQAADHLSYFQDAVATEAYLGTARRRISVRRHARLLDYRMHEGCNARVWLQISAGENADGYLVQSGTPVMTGGSNVVAASVLGLSAQATSAPVAARGSLGGLGFADLELYQFAILGICTVDLGDEVSVEKGHVGANEYRSQCDPSVEVCRLNDGNVSEHPGQFKAGKPEREGVRRLAAVSVSVGVGAQILEPNAAVFGDTVRLGSDARVGDVYCNEIEGTPGGRVLQPLALPVLSSLPDLPEVEHGTQNIEVTVRESTTLSPGAYLDLEAAPFATVVLDPGNDNPGIFVFRNLELANDAALRFVGPCEVRVAGCLSCGDRVAITPQSWDEQEQLPTLVVVGDNGSGCAGRAAVHFGTRNRIDAHVRAPVGDVEVGEHSQVRGTLLARHVRVGASCSLAALQAAQTPESEQDPEPPVVPPERLSSDTQVFETMHDVTLRVAHNNIAFYAWGEESCCLGRDATAASLSNEGNRLAQLAPGDLLLFEEVRGSNGRAADADPSHRHVVRISAVEFVQDPLLFEAEPGPDGTPQPMRVVNVQWNEGDALPFSLCLAEVGDAEDSGPMSVAHGNVVLADHGRTVKDEALVPALVPVEGNYRPRLKQNDLTFAVGYDHTLAESEPASRPFEQDPREALPEVSLVGGGEDWKPRQDLLDSDRFASELVVEMEDDGQAFLRFGDGVLGRKPPSGIALRAEYRVGNGVAGNVGAETLTQIALPARDSELQSELRVRNPMPARGGADREEVEQVRLHAPQAFSVQRRAVTVEDYARLAKEHPDVQEARAIQRWTGSWHTVFLTVDRRGGRPVDPEFEEELRAFLEPFRTMGHDLEIQAPRLVALDILLTCTIGEDELNSAVRKLLLERFSSGEYGDGQRGYFHPDNLSFGQSVFASRLVAAAMEVAGVVDVVVDRLQRLGADDVTPLDKGYLSVGALEIARVDNDPNRPEQGRIDFDVRGGL